MLQSDISGHYTAKRWTSNPVLHSWKTPTSDFHPSFLQFGSVSQSLLIGTQPYIMILPPPCFNVRMIFSVCSSQFCPRWPKCTICLLSLQLLLPHDWERNSTKPSSVLLNPILAEELPSTIWAIFGFFMASLINVLLTRFVRFGGWPSLNCGGIIFSFLIMDLMVLCDIFLGFITQPWPDLLHNFVSELYREFLHIRAGWKTITICVTHHSKLRIWSKCGQNYLSTFSDSDFDTWVILISWVVQLCDLFCIPNQENSLIFELNPNCLLL